MLWIRLLNGLASIPNDPFDKPSQDTIAYPIPNSTLLNLPHTHEESIGAILNEKIVFTGE